jgi:hypothetical protein
LAEKVTESSGGGKSRKRFLKEEQQDAHPGELFGRCLSRSEHLRLRDDAGV